jgi:hypothetical protein
MIAQGFIERVFEVAPRAKLGVLCTIRTSSSGCFTGRGRSKTAPRALKSTTLAPMPAPNSPTAIAANAGESIRAAYRISFIRELQIRAAVAAFVE